MSEPVYTQNLFEPLRDKMLGGRNPIDITLEEIYDAAKRFFEAIGDPNFEGISSDGSITFARFTHNSGNDEDFFLEKFGDNSEFANVITESPDYFDEPPTDISEGIHQSFMGGDPLLEEDSGRFGRYGFDLDLLEELVEHFRFVESGNEEWVAKYLNEEYLSSVRPETWADEVVRSAVMEFIEQNGHNPRVLVSFLEYQFRKAVDAEMDYVLSDQSIAEQLLDGFWPVDEPYVIYVVSEGGDGYFEVSYFESDRVLSGADPDKGPFLNVPRHVVDAIEEDAQEIGGVVGTEGDTTYLWAKRSHLKQMGAGDYA